MFFTTINNYTKAISALILFSYNRVPEVELYYKECKYFNILHTGQIFDKIFFLTHWHVHHQNIKGSVSSLTLRSFIYFFIVAIEINLKVYLISVSIYLAINNIKYPLFIYFIPVLLIVYWYHLPFYLLGNVVFLLMCMYYLFHKDKFIYLTILI